MTSLYTDTLVISGGSTSGFSMLGRLYLLEVRNEIDFSRLITFAGTSVGAIISLLLFIGYRPVEIAYHLHNCDILDKFVQISPRRFLNGQGCFSVEIIRKELEVMVIKKLGYLPTLGQLKDMNPEKNLLCVSFNLDTYDIVYLTALEYPDLDCIQAVLMSASIPIIFEPCVYQGTRYIDGGIMDNCPVLETIKRFHPNNIIVLRCIKKYNDSRDNSIWSMRDILSILFAASNYTMKSHISEAEKVANIKFVDVTSSIPFYDLRISKEMITNLFLHGFFDN